MWDSLNGTLLPTGVGESSQYINFGIAPGMGFLGTGAYAPMGYMGCNYPGFNNGILPYDTFSASAGAPLVAQGGGHGGIYGIGHGAGHGGFISDALKLIGGVAVAIIAFKALKGKRIKAK